MRRLTPRTPLQIRAENLGIQTSYRDAAGVMQHPSESALRRMVSILDRGDAAPPPIDPVVVCWQKRRTRLEVGGVSSAELELEDGSRRKLRGEELRRLPALPTGYHQLRYRSGGKDLSTLIISAPVKLYSEPARCWGAFLPLYANHSQQSWGAGNFSDWSRLADWLARQGANVVGTLPLLSSFLDHPTCEPSPYSPVSRLFWNEFFIDVTAIPEFKDSPAARREAARHGKTLAAFRAGEFIDYPAEWKIRRRVLEILAREFPQSGRQREFQAYLRSRPEAEHYARFRAANESYGKPWRQWPRKTIRSGDYEEAVKDFHLYIQWIAQQQMEQTLAYCRERGVKFYLDLPLGVHPDGFDAWRFQPFFADGTSAGAPPDPYFTKGQDWGFAPLNPWRSRELHYRYVIDFLRFQMRHTGLLRIDHVMGLHRLWWVPHGQPASEGAYMRYPAEELYAILSVESHRNQTMLVGENLGTVPPEVNAGMDRHGLRKMFVLQYEQPQSGPPRTPESFEVASINTHDMPAFAAHWKGLDIADRHELGLIPDRAVPAEKKRRLEMNKNLVAFLRSRDLVSSDRPSPQQLIRGLVRFLAESPAEIVLVNLEDLWLEERWQNLPGTSIERPNWRRKAVRSLDELEKDSRLASFLASLGEFRKRPRLKTRRG